MTSTLLHTLKKYPFIRLLLPMVAGIVLQWYIQIRLFYILIAIAVIITLLVTFIFLPFAKKFSLQWLRGLLIMLLLAALGCCITYTKNITHQKDWFGNYYHPGNALIITLEEPLVEKNRFHTVNTYPLFD